MLFLLVESTEGGGITGLADTKNIYNK